MLNFLGMLKGGAGAMGGAAGSGGDRFFQALGAQKMGSGASPWNRGIGMQYANAAAQMPNFQAQPVNLRLGQQQRSQIQNPILQMLMGGM